MSEEVPKWVQQLIVDVGELKKQTLQNCNKLDSMKENTDMIPAILEIVTANGQGIEVISKRVDKLEK